MAKIPRIEQGDRPSVIVGGAPRADTFAADVTEAAGKLAHTGYEITADMEARESKVLQDALDKKQAIVDEVEATRRIADFDEESFGRMAQLQEQFRDDPSKALQPFIEDARQRQDAATKNVSNADVGLHVARGFASSTRSDTNEMHRWAQTQMTQNAKANIEKIANKSSAKGEQLIGGVDTLAAYVDRQKTAYGPVFDKALGAEAGAARVYKLQSETTYAYFNSRSARHPVDVLSEITATKGPAAEFLDAGQRASLEQRAKASLHGLPLTRQLDDIRSGISRNSMIAGQVMAGKMRPVDMFREIQTTTSEREVIELDKSIGAPEKRNRLAIVDEKLAFLKASDMLMRSQSGFEIADKPGAAAEIVAKQQEILKGVGAKVKLKGTSGLSDVLKQYTAIAQASAGGALPEGAARAMVKQLELAMPAAYTKEAGNTWHWGLPYQDADEIGNAVINKQFNFSYPKASVTQQNDARFRFITAMNDAAATGASTSKETANRLALESVALAMGQDPNGLFAGKAKK